MYHHDDNFAFISLSEAQRIMGLGEAVTSLHLRVDDLDEAVAINKQLDRELGGYPYDFKDWTDLFPELFQWMELEKVGHLHRAQPHSSSSLPSTSCPF